MEIIFGGAFQGKLSYCLENYNLKPEDVQKCNNSSITIDESKKLFQNCHELVLAFVLENKNPLTFFKDNLHKFQDKILIFDEISCGVVPIDETIRKLREENGRVMVYLCGEAKHVTRIFCGIPSRIK